MHLLNLVQQQPRSLDRMMAGSVPDAFIGVFRRNSISFANGLSDFDTRVFWLQSRNYTIDLRLPKLQKANLTNLGERDVIEERLETEGWMASSLWTDGLLGWEGGESYQLENRWPEKARLERIGNSLVEFAPSGAYVEDWRFQPSNSGPIVALKMINEKNEEGDVLRKGGGLFILGDFMGFVRPRTTKAQEQLNHFSSLREVEQHLEQGELSLNKACDFEVSLARKSKDREYLITDSTQPWLEGAPANLEGFSWKDSSLIQELEVDGRKVIRTFYIDMMISNWNFGVSTPCFSEATQWMKDQEKTLGRYWKPKV